MAKIQLSKCGYSVAVDGNIVIYDARTKDAAYSEACLIAESFRAIGVNSVILNSQGLAI